MIARTISATLALSIGLVACAGQNVDPSAAIESNMAYDTTGRYANSVSRDRQVGNSKTVEICDQFGGRTACDQFDRERVMEDLQHYVETLRLEDQLQ